MPDRGAGLNVPTLLNTAGQECHLHLVAGTAVAAAIEAPPPTLGAQTDAEPAIQPAEAEFAAALFRLLLTPRAATRFAGVYRQLKSGIRPQDMARFEGSDGSTGEYQVPMLLLAIQLGAPAAADRLFPALRERATHDMELRDLLAHCAAIAPRMASLAMVEQTIQPIVANLAFPAEPALFRLWLPRIARYTFDVGAAPRSPWRPPGDLVSPGPATRPFPR